MALILEPTTQKCDEIRESFNTMIEAIPKRRRGDHAFAINEIHLIIDALDRRAKGK